MRDPFLHFLCIGLALLALYHVVSPARPQAPGSRIELTQDDLRQIDLAWMAKWQRHPTQAEMQGLVEAKVREEILYREALTLGLDQDDTIIKRRLAQKLEFLTEDTSAIRDPTPHELQAWFAGNSAQFATPGRVTFRHVYFSPDKRGVHAADDARMALATLSGKSTALGADTKVGDRFFDRDYYPDRTPDQVASLFGTRFAQSLFKLQPGAWQGPVESGLGWHLVRIDAMSPGSVPTFEEVDREQVKAAWIDERRAESRRTTFAAIKAKYEVVLPGTSVQ